MPLPLRVLIKGPSTVLWTSMMGGPRTDLAFPRVMEQALLARGRSVEVRNTAVLGWPTPDLFKTWDDDIVAWSPDIVILAVGHYESLHAYLPRWLERGANTVNRRPGLFRDFYYRKFLRATARGVLILQKKIDRPRVTLRRRMRRVITDTAAYIKMTQQVGHPLILLMEIHPPSGIKREWYGGWTERIRRLNEDLRGLVATLDRPDVRFVEITDLVEKFDPAQRDRLWTDGIHFIPEFHRAVGEKFADVAEEWASEQPHLAHP
jgi:hypothetical protein